MKNMQICPACAEPITETARILSSCPHCGVHLKYSGRSAAEAVFMYVTSAIAIAVILIFVYRYSMPIQRGTWWADAVMILAALLQWICNGSLYAARKKRMQVYVLCDTNGDVIRRKPQFTAEVRLSAPQYQKELAADNILLLQSGDFKTYIVLTKLHDRTACAFYPIPDTDTAYAGDLPEQANLWNGEAAVAAISGIQKAMCDAKQNGCGHCPPEV